MNLHKYKKGEHFKGNVFRDYKGAYMTAALFLETRTNDTYPPLYTFEPEDMDHPEYGLLKSASKIYLESNDPTEYAVAMTLVKSWDHWLRLVNSKKVGPFIKQLRDELEVKLRSEAIREMAKISTEGVKGISAARWLAEGSWKGKRGRPKKAEVERQMKIDAKIQSEVDEDFNRIQDLLNEQTATTAH